MEKSDKYDKTIIKLQNELLRFNDVDRYLRENSTKIEETSRIFNDYQFFSNKKFSELDNSVFTVLDALKDVNRDLEKRGSGNIGGSFNLNMNNLMNANAATQDTTNTQLVENIGKSNKEIDNLKKLFREFNEKVDKIYKTNISLEEQIKEIKQEKPNQKRSSNTELDNNTSSKGKDMDNNDKIPIENDNNINEITMENDSIKLNIDALFDRMKKFQDVFKNVTINLGQKAEKSEYDKFTRGINQEIERLNKRIKDMGNNTDKSGKTLQGDGGGGNKNEDNTQDGPETKVETQKNVIKKKGNASDRRSSTMTNKNIKANLSNGDGFEFDEGIVNMTREIIEKELQNKEEFILINQFMEEHKTKSENNKKDIDKLYESLVEIRSSIANNTLFDQKLQDINDKIDDVDLKIKKQKLTFEERLKALEGEPAQDEEVQNQENQYGGSIKDNIKNLNVNMKSVMEKIDKVTLRQDNMNNEILTKVKKDLSAESGKILTEFKGDLKVSITKIEDQLREKVDKFSLEEFGKYVNEKLSSEIGKKLDKNDLKRNNNMINKKIDTLENKISKTLVDTLIDLQMEEAPLIVKKPFGGGGGEKCASCNQLVINNQVINEENLNGEGYNNNNNKNIHNMTIIPSKFKFKNVQESCYKYGAGSYSRYLSSIDNPADDLRYNKSLQLPEIISNKTTKKFHHVIGNAFNETKLKNKILEEYTEKNLNAMLNEELEKKIVNPENLIKTANKLYETVEKEKRNFMNNNNLNNK